MAFTPRTRNQLRDSLLDGLRTRFAAAGRRLLATPRTWVYRLADALGVELEGLEAVAGDLVREVFPDTATPQGVARHGSVYGVPRRPAVSAHLRVRVSGPASTTVAIPDGRKLTTSPGAGFTPFAASVAINGSSVGYLEIAADVAGEAGNLPAGTVLTWSAAPAGLGPTAVVEAGPGDTSSILSAGEDQESVASWALRIIDKIQERPASGNRSDWRDWVEGVDGIGEAYVYPRTNPTGFVRDTLGCVTVVALAPKPTSYVQDADGTLPDGLDPAYERVASTELLDRANGYIRGELDVHGNAVPLATRRELYTANMDPTDWATRAPVSTQIASVRVQVKADPARFTWPFETPVPLSSATTNTITFTLVDWDSVGGFAVGDQLSVPLGPTFVRGYHFLVSVVGVNAGTRTITVSPPMPVAPAAATLVYPDCGIWSEARRLMLTMYESLGPGLFETGNSWRYPPESFRGPATLYIGKVYGAVMAASGVIDAVVLHPTASVVPSPGVLVVPAEIRFERMP